MFSRRPFVAGGSARTPWIARSRSAAMSTTALFAKSEARPRGRSASVSDSASSSLSSELASSEVAAAASSMPSTVSPAPELSRARAVSVQTPVEADVAASSAHAMMKRVRRPGLEPALPASDETIALPLALKRRGVDAQGAGGDLERRAADHDARDVLAFDLVQRHWGTERGASDWLSALQTEVARLEHAGRA